jgi:hypothetical protein
MIRSLPVLGALLAISSVATSALADEETVTVRHRVTGALGPAFTFIPPGDDGHWHQSGFGAGARLSYSFRIARAIELGAGATYFRVAHDDGPDMVLPALSIRTHWTLRGGTEIGVSGKAGLTFLRITDVPVPNTNWTSRSNVVWFGSSFAIPPDIRTPLAPQTWLLVSLELAVGGGNTDRSRIDGTYLREQASFGQVGLWFGVVQGL